jgi:predicted nucleic acid-binding protein
MILVDTNAWISHLRKSDSRLVTFLLEHRVRTCDVVVGELMLGSGLPRNFSRDLMVLPRLPTPSAAQAREFIERHRESLAGSGVGWADVQILATVTSAGARLHSSDRAVRRVCRSLSIVLA